MSQFVVRQCAGMKPQPSLIQSDVTTVTLRHDGLIFYYNSYHKYNILIPDTSPQNSSAILNEFALFASSLSACRDTIVLICLLIPLALPS